VAPVMPDEEAYPYAVRVTSDVTASDGSSSMATVCGASLALMDAGVPIASPVAGISVGLVTPPEFKRGDKVRLRVGMSGDPLALRASRWKCVCVIAQYVLLTDILGMEDHFGDMDFKVAGTHDGITAVQLDIKLDGVPLEVLAQGVYRARAAREVILDAMNKCEYATHSVATLVGL
jgi:polyribonucleotide nucleotidyltransferase